MNILIIEDQKEMQELYSAFFHEEFKHFNCAYSQDGVDGYFKCNITKYDLIILDHEMPRMTGMSLLLALRNNPGINQKTPVIFISAFLDNSSNNMNLFENVLLFSKPFDFSYLASLLKATKIERPSIDI